MKLTKRIVSIALTLLLLLGTVTALPLGVSAKNTDLAEIGGYDTSYTLTGNGAADMVGIANKQLWKSGYELGYSSRNWCSFFIGQCAKLVGQSTAIPYYGLVRDLYPNVIAAGGKIVSVPQAGDLVFYYCEWSNPNYYCHVGLMIDSVNSIQGNMAHIQEDVDRVRPIVAESGYYHCSATNSNCTKKIYVRPNYQGGGTPVTPSNPLPGASTLGVHPGTTSDYTAFSWTATDNTDHYELWVKNPVDNSTVVARGDLTSTNYQLQLPAGNYKAYVASIDYDRYEANISPWWTYSNEVSFTVTDKPFTPTVSIHYGDSYYELYNLTMPWTEAKKQCEAMGGHLVTITSQEENDIIAQLTSYGGRYAYWIGITDEIIEGAWRTVNGEAVPYENWADGQPNNQNNEDYVHVRTQQNAKWNDATDMYANQTLGFICEYKYDPTYITSVSFDTHNESKYEVFNVLMTWDEAKAYCESLGGHLVTISDKAEADYVNTLVKNGGVSAYWLGITDQQSEGTWQNITNEPLSYTNWAAGEPNNSGNVEHCGVIRYDESYSWNDLAATSYCSFICEYDKYSSVPDEKPTTEPNTTQSTDPTEETFATAPTVEHGTFPSTSPRPSTVITTPDSNPADIPILPSDELVADAEIADQETGYVYFNWSPVDGASYYDFTLYDYDGKEVFTHEISDTTYVFAPEDTVFGYFSVASKDIEENILSESALYSFILMDNEIQLAGNYGDVDENFKINIKDATAIQKYLANITELSDFAARLADANADNKVNIKDATTIQKYCANLKPKSRIGEMLTDSYIQQEVFIEKVIDSNDPTEATDGTTGDDIVPPIISEPVTTEPTEPTQTETTTSAIVIPDISTEATVPDENLLAINYGTGFTTANVGDTITYSLMLEADEELDAVQAVINFDSTKLKISNEHSDMCSNLVTADSAPVINATNNGKVFFNASTSSIFDFTDKKPLITIEFEVIGTGETEISHEIEVLHMSYTNDFYFNYGEPVVTEGISLAPVIESEDALSIIAGNQTFTANAGDTITYYVELQADELFEDIQGSVFYDSTKLKLIPQSTAQYCPLLSKQIEDMYDLGTSDFLENEFTFAAVEVVDGFDFTEKRTLVMLEFEVLETGTTSIDCEIDNMTIFGGESYYFYSGIAGVTDGITLTTSIE